MYKEASLIDRRPLALGSSSSKARPKAPSTCLWQRVWARFDAEARDLTWLMWSSDYLDLARSNSSARRLRACGATNVGRRPAFVATATINISLACGIARSR